MRGAFATTLINGHSNGMEYLDLKGLPEDRMQQLQEALCRVLRSGRYLQGKSVQRFETHYADYIGTRHCVGCGNGFDALWLILRAYMELGVMREGDEVIVPANTFQASVLAIAENRLVPVLVEPRAETLEIDDRLVEQAITARTRAVMIVHLYGNCAYTSRIADLCRQYGLKLIEDNAQAHGCEWNGRKTGSLGDAAGHSFYPTKNLGALGDAGAVTTDDDRLAEMVRCLGNYGNSQKYVFSHCGRNSRMDEVQAAVLDVKLAWLDVDNRVRRRIAAVYDAMLSHHPLVQTVRMSPGAVYHIYPVFCERRDDLRRYLEAQGIGTAIHYPIPPHHQACFPALNGSFPVTERLHQQELSLPCHPLMQEEEAVRVANLVNAFR